MPEVPTKMRLLIRISEADIGRVSQGQNAHFTVSAFKDESFSGEILSVPESPIEGTGAVVYEVSTFVENPDYMLKSGMTADVTVKTAQSDKVMRIPTAALRFIPPDGSAHASTSEVWVKTRSGAIKRVSRYRWGEQRKSSPRLWKVKYRRVTGS